MANDNNKFIGTSIIKFFDTFKTDNDCKAYLFNLKFSNGFICPKCSSKDAWNGIKPYTMVCKSCRHVDSCTAGTLFHKCKFGLRKAFSIVFEMSTTSAGISANQISRKYEINYDTAWLFAKKVRVSMESSQAYPMTGKVYVDEFVIGGKEKGAVGRKTDSKKIKAIMAVEVTNQNRVKRVYSMKLENYSSEEIKKIFDKHIAQGSSIHTDEWRSYRPLADKYILNQDKATKTNSPVNRMIQQLKSGLRGTYHSISSHHAETYFAEFSFKINRSQTKEILFGKCVERMENKPKKERLQLSAVKCKTREEFVKRVTMLEYLKVPYEIRGGKVVDLNAKEARKRVRVAA
jgi:transposase-like protein